MIDRDMRERLASLGVPVLLPEQQRQPLEYQEETPDGDLLDGGRSGPVVYLEQVASSGYVQIEQPLPIGSDSLTGTFWTAVTCLAPTPERALELALTVRRLLCGWNYAPGPYRETTPGQPLADPSGFWLHRATYEAKTLDGQAV